AAPKCSAPAVQSEAGTGRFSVTLPGACAQLVHDTPDVWAEAVVAKVALPKVHIGAVPYALQADGAKLANTAKIATGVECQGCVKVAAMGFDKDVDLGGNKLATGAGGAVLQSGKLDLSGAAGDELTSAQVKTLTGGGNADALHTHAGSGGGGGGQVIKFKGVTQKTMDGGQGLAAMNAACANEYGAARMCTSAWISAMFPEPVPAVPAWALVDGPVVPVGPAGVIFLDGAFAANGLDSGFCSGGSGPFTNSINMGRSWQPTGKFLVGPCNKAMPIACCGP
ncbi:MAG: hypothetical protein FJ100_19930, partial [Deltaproteobacteria bacterium]|nr:hypothetical protein [Deltaproteobacteria bacterium]